MHGVLVAADLQVHKAFHRKSSEEVFRDTDFLRAAFQEYHKNLPNVQQALYRVKAIMKALKATGEIQGKLTDMMCISWCKGCMKMRAGLRTPSTSVESDEVSVKRGMT